MSEVFSFSKKYEAPPSMPGAEPPDISVIIVSYNVAGLLEECLSSVFEAGEQASSSALTPDAPFPRPLQTEVIVVDNASTDGSAALVRSRFPAARLIENRYNYGFPRGCNQGLRQARGHYLFFLNPDARVEPGGLATLVDFMDNHPRAGVAGPLVRYGDGRIQPNRRRFPGPGLALVESTILQRYYPFKKLPALPRFYYAGIPPDHPHQVDWLVGAAFVVRRKLIEQIGGLDERFFMYSEELDFCRRAKAAGWEIWYTPATTVTHQEGQSSGQDVPARHINFNTSKLAYYRKYYGPLYAGLLRLFLLATYLFQYAEEAGKLALGHKPALRRQRLALIRQVLSSRFRPYRSPYPRAATELDLCLISAEYYPQPGGIGDYTALMALALEQIGFGPGQVWVMTGGSVQNEPIPKDAASAEAGPDNLYPASGLVADWNWRCLPALARQLRHRKTDLVNIQYQTGAYGMHPAINFLPLYLRLTFGVHRPRVLTTFHDLRVPYLWPRAGRVRRWVNQLLLRTSDLALVTNPADYRQARQWGMPPAKLKLLPISSNIPPVEKFAGASEREHFRQRLGLGQAEFAIGYFGLTNRSKGLDTLLEAVAQMRPGTPGVKIVIIGGEAGQTDRTNRQYARELEGLIKSLGLEQTVIRTGHLAAAETSRALYALDAVALPFRDGASFRRGSLLAPLAHGLPVVTTRPDPESENWADLPQLIDGRNVLLVDPGDPGALATALTRLKDDAALRTGLGHQAKLLADYFSWERTADRLKDILQNC